MILLQYILYALLPYLLCYHIGYQIGFVDDTACDIIQAALHQTSQLYFV